MRDVVAPLYAALLTKLHARAQLNALQLHGKGECCSVCNSSLYCRAVYAKTAICFWFLALWRLQNCESIVRLFCI